jgi:hypothetical protein
VLSYPAIRECATPRDLPVDAVTIDEEDPLDLHFQDSQGTRKAYLAETAALAYMSPPSLFGPPPPPGPLMDHAELFNEKTVARREGQKTLVKTEPEEEVE